MIFRAALALTLPFAGSALAQGITLSSPIECDLGRDCHIQQYVDHDASTRVQDYHCASLSYDGHKGTDFALRHQKDMGRDIRVLASAPGVVMGVRDGMPDTGITKATADQIKDRECGNGVVLDHGGGWQTQYCHMKQGSVTVAKGDRVESGTPMGFVGQSGKAAFAHVHLSVRKDGKVVDPFDPDGALSCNSPGDSTLWADPPPYRAGGVLEVGFADHVPDYAAVKAGTGASAGMTVQSDALVVYGFLFGTRAGDRLTLSLDGPQGTIVKDDIDLTKTQAQSFRAIGKKRRGDWPAGAYTGQVALTRNGTVIDQQITTMTLQ